MFLLYVVFFILVIFIVLLTIYKIIKDNFDSKIIRLDEAENSIEKALNNRYELLSDINSNIKSELESNVDAIKALKNINRKETNNFDLDKDLYDSISDLNEYVEDHLMLKEMNNYDKIIKES